MVASFPDSTHFKVRRMRKCDFRHPPVQCVNVFLLVKVGFQDVKSLVEHNGEG